MVGGYVCVTLLSKLGLPFVATLPLAFIAAAIVGLALERALYRRLYKPATWTRCCFRLA